ncbi:hypothetical protein GJAV_G00171530 [Gymnothorax javanicus]|nr:hypothetical protein GJAV_G00171530 [Gymnothorax javanicus]
MMSDPLRSALCMKHVEETSLAVPSDTRLKSGHQRVLDQVHTIKRGKKHTKSSSSSTTATSGSTLGFSEFRRLKYSTLASNGSVFSKGNANGGTTFKKTVNSHHTLHPNGNYIHHTLHPNGNYIHHTLHANGNYTHQTLPPNGNYTKASTGGRRTVSTSSQWERRVITGSNTRSVPRQLVQTDGLKPSRSDPELMPKPAVVLRNNPNFHPSANRSSMYSMNSGNGHMIHTSSAYAYRSAPNFGFSPSASGNNQLNIPRASSHISNAESKISVTKARSEFMGEHMNGAVTDLTMKEAVEYLKSQDENYQHCGASFIQHSTFTEDKAKQEVFQQKGIPLLVDLLRSPSTQVQQTASGALRNLVFKNERNKEEVQKCHGISEASALLRDTNNSETQKQLTGLLWNLSSADSLKPELIKTALPVLSESVLVPFTGSEEKPADNKMDPDVFYSATGCLRNLCCGKKGNRKALRNSRGLIDSLVRYVQGCVNAGRPDDKSVENCVCVLHNLTYQLETEAPNHFSKISALAGAPTRSSAPTTPTSPIGCFSQQSGKVPQETFDYPVIEDSSPKGAGWLFHSKAMQTYLALLSDSENDTTKEACVGTLQNLTANKGIVSNVMSQSIVQKLNGLQNIAPLLQSSNPGIQKTAVALTGNLARNPRLQRSMARQTLPQLVAILSSPGENGADADDTMATACQTVGSLLVADPETGKKQLNNRFINSLNELSRNSYFSKSSKAAALLLYGLWAEKNFQGYLKKQGFHKSSFSKRWEGACHRRRRRCKEKPSHWSVALLHKR